MDLADKYIIEWFNSDFGTNFSGGIVGNILLILFSIGFAALFSGLIGYERETHGHSAGLRTHLLVAVGSAIVMVVSLYGFSTWEGTRDPARLAAQVVSGIGFLGAGTIIKSGISVRGLTTATTLWVCMAIGLACGSGSFVIAAIGTAISLIALVSMRKIERKAAKKNPMVFLVYAADKAVMGDVLKVSSRYGITVHDVHNELIEYQGHSSLRLSFRCASATKNTLTAFMEELKNRVHPYEIKVSIHNLGADK